MSHPPKRLVRQSFDRAAATYDRVAQVQRRICGQLAKRLPGMMTPGIILDAGCGTGFALRLLRERFPPANLIGLDTSMSMLERVRPDAHRLAGDAEHLPLADASVGLYWSSLTLQWCDFAASLAEARRIVWPNGWLAIATLGPGTFGELSTAFAAADAYRHTLAFHTPEHIEKLVQDAGFRDIKLRREPHVSHHPDLKTLLKAVKAMGASQVGTGRRPGLMSRGAWLRAEAAYEKLREPSGLPLTYDVITIVAQK